MATVATLEVQINGKDTGVEKMLAALEKRLRDLDKASKSNDPLKPVSESARKATPNVLALAQAEARLLTAQGNLAGASLRLEGALAQVSTKSVQTVNAQRQLLAVQTQLATGTSGLGGHFKSLQGSMGAVGGAIGGLPGQLLGVTTGIGAVTAAIGIGVGVVQSFGEAFKFKANLDATTASINAQLKGVRDTSQVYAEAAQFANTYKLTQQETTEAIQASIGVMRTSKAGVEDILGVLARMQVLSPEQSLQEAAIALKALASGDTTSLVTRFEVGRDVANQMKQEILGGADAVAVMSQFLGTTGIGMDTLAAKTTGAMGAMKELAQAQEQLKLAQAAFAEGPGLVILEGQIRVVSGATRLLTGDFAAMGQGIASTTVEMAASSAAANAYAQALQNGQGVLAAEAAAAAAAAQATALLTGAHRDGGGGSFEFAAAENVLIGSMSAESAAAVAATDATLTHTAAVADAAGKAQIASVASQELAVTQNALAAAAQTAANVILAGGGNIAAVASSLASSSSQVDVLTAAYLRLAAAQATATGAKLQNQTARQLTGADSDEANIRRQRSAGIKDDRNVRVKASGDAAEAERNYQQTLGNTAPAMARARSELAQLTKGSAAYINKQNDIAKLQQQAEKGAKGGGGGGGGGVKLTDQAKLNNSLLASQESFDAKAEDAEQSHLDRILAINQDFGERVRAAQDTFGQSQLDGRASFYDSLGGIEDAGLRSALSAQYEAAFAEAEQIAATKGADVADKFLQAKQAAIQAQGQRASDIATATKEGDKDKAAYLAGVDKLYRDAEARKLAAITGGEGSIAAQRDAQLAEEGVKYDAAQAKIGDSADTAAQRKVLAAQRAGQAIDAEGLKVDTLAGKYDALGAAGSRAGITPAATATGAATGAPVPAQAATAVPGDDPVAAAILSLRGALEAIEAATKNGAEKVAGAVKAIPRSVA